MADEDQGMTPEEEAAYIANRNAQIAAQRERGEKLGNPRTWMIAVAVVVAVFVVALLLQNLRP